MAWALQNPPLDGELAQRREEHPISEKWVGRIHKPTFCKEKAVVGQGRGPGFGLFPWVGCLCAHVNDLTGRKRKRIRRLPC